MNMSTLKHSVLYLRIWRAHTHTSETVNPNSYTRQHMHSQVKHFQQIRKLQFIKFNPDRQNTSHKHHYLDQCYHINSIAKHHIIR